MGCEFEGLIFGLAYTWKGFAIFQYLCFGESVMCGSRKYPGPHHGGNWKFQGGGGGQRPRKFQKGGGLDHKITFQGVNIISFSTCIRTLLLTDLVDHF